MFFYIFPKSYMQCIELFNQQFINIFIMFITSIYKIILISLMLLASHCLECLVTIDNFFSFWFIDL